MVWLSSSSLQITWIQYTPPQNSLLIFHHTRYPFTPHDVWQRRSITYQTEHYPTNRHMYLSCFSEYPPSLKKYILYSQFFQTQERPFQIIISTEAQIQMYFYFLWRDYQHGLIQEVWEQSSNTPRKQMLVSKTTDIQFDTPFMSITT